MLNSNKFELILTGTNFGPLGNYPKAEYVDSYFFSDLFGNTNILYTDTLSGNTFLTGASTPSITAMPGLVAWVDASDRRFVLTGVQANVIGITGIVDKSPNRRLFKTDTMIDLVYWPLSGGFLSTNIAANIRYTNFLYNETLKLALTSPFTLFFVWKDGIRKEFGDSYPLCLQTEFQSNTSEIVLINNYITKRSTWGYRDTTFGVVFTGLPFESMGENYFVWTHTGNGPIALSSQYLQILNNPVSATDFYFISGVRPFNGTTIGSLCADYANDFIFGEMLLFNRVVSGVELIGLTNAINNKWNFNTNYIENVNFNTTITGGILSSTSYEDFSLLTSNIIVPLQSCVTLLTINLSTFDITASDISRIECDYKGKIYSVTSSLSSKNGNIQPFLNNNKIDIVLMPSADKFVDTYTIKMSVFKFDSTINKLILSGAILKCNVLDYYNYNTKLIDSQILDNTKDILLVAENTENKTLFLNKLNVNVPVQVLSGGDIEGLVNNDVINPNDDVILLTDLLNIEESNKTTFKVPILPPIPKPRINPILPN